MPAQNWMPLIHRDAPPADSNQPGVGSAVQDAIVAAGEDALTSALLPSNHADPDVRDRTDASHADMAFTGILAAAVAAVGTITIASGPFGVSATAGAAALIRAAWAGMSYREKARIWRGEVTR